MTSLIYLAGRAALQDGVVVVWLAGLGVLGVLTYPVLLKDTASVRDMGFMWQPKSWYYVLIGFGTPLVTLILLGQRYSPAVRQLLTIIVFILVTCSVNVFYLYRRHRFLGTP